MTQTSPDVAKAATKPSLPPPCPPSAARRTERASQKGMAQRT
jgi:hypothetical protein